MKEKILDYLYHLYIDYIWMPFNGFRNLWTWKKIIWQDAQFDYSFMLRILIKKLELMENGFRLHGCCTNSERVAKEIKILRLIVERIERDEYVLFERFGKPDYKHGEYLARQDLEYFGKIINKKLRCWWD